MRARTQAHGGSVTLNSGDALVANPLAVRWRNICELRTDEVTPLEVSIGVEVAGVITGDPEPTPPLRHGQWSSAYIWEAPAWGFSQLRLEYGSAEYARDMRLDLRAGRYYLGPCTWARVSARRFAVASPIPGIDIAASGFIGPAAGGSYDRPTLGCIASVDGGGSFDRGMGIPPGFVDVTPIWMGNPYWGGAHAPLWFTVGSQEIQLTPGNTLFLGYPPPRLSLIGNSPFCFWNSYGVVVGQDVFLGAEFTISL